MGAHRPRLLAGKWPLKRIPEASHRTSATRSAPTQAGKAITPWRLLAGRATAAQLGLRMNTRDSHGPCEPMTINPAIR